jgi:hypothetical protein
VLRRFYSYALDSCVEIEAKSVGFAHQAPGLADTASAKSVTGGTRHGRRRCPRSRRRCGTSSSASITTPASTCSRTASPCR